MNVTERSIFEQFEFWEALPKFVERAEPGKSYAVIGCGTSFNLSQSIAAHINANGAQAVAVPGHEWTIRPELYAPGKVEVIVVSRSGESSEAVTAAQASQARGLHVTAIGCEPQSTLVRMADTALVAPTHPAEGIVMTASASLMLLLGMQFAGIAIDRQTIAANAQTALNNLAELSLTTIENRKNLVFLGGGSLYGIAAEGGLKVQEMSCSITQVYHPLEYRHGPISLVDQSVVAIMLYTQDDSDAETKLAGEVRELGAGLIGIGGPGDVSIPVAASDETRGAVILPALQLLGERVAQMKGLDTSAPRHLNKVVKIS